MSNYQNFYAPKWNSSKSFGLKVRSLSFSRDLVHQTAFVTNVPFVLQRFFMVFHYSVYISKMWTQYNIAFVSRLFLVHLKNMASCQKKNISAPHHRLRAQLHGMFLHEVAELLKQQGLLGPPKGRNIVVFNGGLFDLWFKGATGKNGWTTWNFLVFWFKLCENGVSLQMWQAHLCIVCIHSLGEIPVLTADS